MIGELLMALTCIFLGVLPYWTSLSLWCLIVGIPLQLLGIWILCDPEIWFTIIF